MKKKTKGILIGLVALGVIGMFVPNEEETASQEPKQEEVKEETKIEVEETTVEEVEINEEETDKMVKQALIETFISSTQSIAEDSFDYANVEYDEELDLITMTVAYNGLANDVAMFKLGALDKSEWNIVKDSVNSTCEIMKTQLEELSLTDVSASIVVLNDSNQENVLYISTNGFCVYDCLAE